MRRHSAVESRSHVRRVVERLRRAADLAAQKAGTLRRPVLAWATAPMSSVDALEVFAWSPDSHRIFWTRPDERFGLAGIGGAWTFTPDGPGRFERAAADWRACLDDAVGDETDADGAIAPPLALGGFAFSPDRPASAEWSGFPAAAIVVPSASICTVGDACWLTLAVRVQPNGRAGLDEASAHVEKIVESSERDPCGETAERDVGAPVLHELPPGERWKAAVERAVRAVRDGVLTKIVLARTVSVRGVRTSPATALRRLRAGYPNCAVFAVTRGDRCFLGATPERLVRVRRDQVSTMAVAGSAPRGQTPDEDRRFGEAMLKSAKDRLEHAVVADVLGEVMAETCADVTPAAPPTVMKIANIQHLVTPLAGRLREPTSVLELTGRFHPTPAVGGMPRDRALRWMRDLEESERGWYAGPVGWMDRRGDGEFAVAIRSALMRGNEALLFAGCGIVADSDPDQEYAESWLKLRPVLSALGIER